jgi:hypothetical protein
MAHTFVHLSSDAVNDTFICSACGKTISLNVQGVGEPCAVQTDGVWEIPAAVVSNAGECSTVPADGIVITKRQFLIQLIRTGLVSSQEATTLATQPPSMMDPILANMTEEEAIEVRLSWASMTEVERYSPLVMAAAQANNLSAQDLDAFFEAASLI